MNYYQFHIGDFRSGTVHMSRQMRWIYRDMLDVYYDTEKPLPLDFEELCNEIGVESDDERSIVEKLLRFKFEQQDDGYHNAVCNKVIADYRSKAEIAKENGRRGGRPKNGFGLQSKPSGFLSGSNQGATSNQQETVSQTNHKPLTINQEPIEKIKTKPSLSSSDLVALGVDEKVAQEFVAMRKRKRAPMTEIVLEGIKRESANASMSLNDALRTSIERGWQSFKAEWVVDKSTGAKKHADFSSQDYRAGITEDGRF